MLRAVLLQQLLGSPSAGSDMTTAVGARQWWARGGPAILGKVVPGVVASIAVTTLAGALQILIERGWNTGSAPFLFLMVIALLTAWLAWKLVRTVWSIMLAEGTFTCLATGGRWTLEPGEVLAVKGDAYNLFLVMVSAKGKIWLWACLDDRLGLLAAVRRANPSVEFDPWIDPSHAH